MSSIVSRLLRRTTSILGIGDPILVMPFRGFANRERFFLKGRVLENEGILNGTSQSVLRNLRDNLLRFESDEIPGAKLAVHLAGKEYHTETDREGYFTLDLPWHSTPSEPENMWLPASVKLLHCPKTPFHTVQTTNAEVLLPSKNASFGIISDIDDTVLQTFITSRFKLKMLYATLFKDSHNRVPMEGMPSLLQLFKKGENSQKENPFFYVSDSPWNIYDMLSEFMQFNDIPKGPILLRDYGLNLLWRKKDQLAHKLEAFRRILNMYPDLPFVMLGDTASFDADYYLQMEKEFPGRVRAIYIRQTRDTANARRIAKLIEMNSQVALKVHSSKEILEDAKRRGLVN